MWCSSTAHWRDLMTSSDGRTRLCRCVCLCVRVCACDVLMKSHSHLHSLTHSHITHSHTHAHFLLNSLMMMQATTNSWKAHVLQPLLTVRDELTRTFRDRPSIVSPEVSVCCVIMCVLSSSKNSVSRLFTRCDTWTHTHLHPNSINTGV